MYNKEYKEAFINALDRKEDSKLQYMSMFNVVEPIEAQIGKDIFDMNMDELDDLFYKLGRKTSRSAVQFFNLIKSYITWAKDNGYSESRLHPIVDTINNEFVEKYLYKAGNQYYTREEILESIKHLVNPRDKAIVLCLFEGIFGKSCSEIVNLRYEDIIERDGKYYVSLLSDEINLTNRQLEISKELYDLLILTYNTQETWNEKGNKSRVVDGEFIFRKNRVGSNGDIRLTQGLIVTKYMEIIKTAFDDVQLSASRINSSGLMWYANEFMNQERVLNKEIVSKLVEKFDLPTTTVNGTVYPSYTRFRERIDINYMTRVYGEFKISF